MAKKQKPIKAQEPKAEADEFWHFMVARPDSGTTDRSDDPKLACLAVAVATQVTAAGFQRRLMIDLREAPCPDCKAPGYNTGMGFWMHACGSEWLSDGEPSKLCGVGERANG